MKYVAIFHANLNYAYLEEYKYEQVIRASYETIIDTFREKCPEAKYVFEASGFTIEQMAKKTPDVLKKLIDAVERGQCEFMGAPYAHPIMANIPEEDGHWSNYFSMETYKKHMGFKPESAWNPECTWMQYVPRTFRDVGYKYMTLDFESYMNCNDDDYANVEKNWTRDIGWGGHIPNYDLDPDCRFLHQPFKDVVPGLNGFCRSDRLIGDYVGYFLNRSPLEEYLEKIKHWSGKKDKGATIIIADDAEYTGTTGYFYVKRYRDYSKSFAIDSGASEKLEKLVTKVQEMGEFVTFKEACELEPVEEPFYVEDRYAWHKTYADAWAGTPEAKAWDPLLAEMRRDYKDKVQKKLEGRSEYKALIEKFWFHMTNSANSDGRWPAPPAETCPFNRQWVLNEIEKTENILNELKEKSKNLNEVPFPEPERKIHSEHYDYYFTDKELEDTGKLNKYELQHALYVGNAEYDNGDREYGKKLIKKIFREFEKRGMKNFIKPEI